MFRAPDTKTKARTLFAMAEVIYHSIVRNLRSSHRNAVIGLVLTMVQSLVMIIAFLVMFMLLGVKSSPIRGDFLLFVMSGIFMFMTHIKTVSSVAGGGSPVAAMMQHAPMNTIIGIISAAVSTLYQQVLTMMIILSVYHIAITPITIHNPVGAFGMLLLSWFSGVAVGMLFLALNPWIPDLAGLIRSMYIRINMIASGKMFVVNTLPATMVSIFDWNPLFHIIDQTRGFVFLNYNPHVTSISYPIYLSLTLIMIGLMGEFYTRKSVSVSWFASR
ncbi:MULTISPECIES: ABC transporter permease [unclassified Yoonia]|uniref:ABC transporter permease n=1 Tax=unclassified Yoonia TaxID=2629118 RepID=UPI002AFF3063|nr:MULTISPECIES: ABC transporter permease [unclassified Yoonia]